MIINDEELRNIFMTPKEKATLRNEGLINELKQLKELSKKKNANKNVKTEFLNSKVTRLFHISFNSVQFYSISISFF